MLQKNVSVLMVKRKTSMTQSQIIRESPAEFENLVKPWVDERRITRSTKKLHFVSRKRHK